MAGSVAGRFLFKNLSVVRLIMEGLKRCFGLVRAIQVSQTGIHYPGPIAYVTSRVLVALKSVTTIRHVSEAPTEGVFSSGVKSPPEKALGHFHKSML